MVNWHDPLVELECARLAVFFFHIVSGTYIWEFFVSFPFDWEHLRGRRPWRWTLALYFIARYCGLIVVVGAIRVSNVPQPISDCTAWWQLIFGSAYIAAGTSSLLLVLRTIAVTQCHRLISAFLVMLWLAGVGTMINSTATVKGIYILELSSCGTVNAQEERFNFFLTAGLDLVCIIMMLGYLMLAQGSSLWKFLATQGTVYFLVSLLAYIPTTVLIMLDLNDAMHEILQPVTIFSLVVCATRMYRGLINFHKSGSPDPFTITAASTNLSWTLPRTQQQNTTIPMPVIYVQTNDGRAANSTYSSSYAPGEDHIGIKSGDSITDVGGAHAAV